MRWSAATPVVEGLCMGLKVPLLNSLRQDSIIPMAQSVCTWWYLERVLYYKWAAKPMLQPSARSAVSIFMVLISSLLFSAWSFFQYLSKCPFSISIKIIEWIKLSLHPSIFFVSAASWTDNSLKPTVVPVLLLNHLKEDLKEWSEELQAFLRHRAPWLQL